MPDGDPYTLASGNSFADGTNGGPGTKSYSWAISSGAPATINPGTPDNAQNKRFTITRPIPPPSNSPIHATAYFTCTVSNSTSGQSVTRTVSLAGTWHTGGTPL